MSDSNQTKKRNVSKGLIAIIVAVVVLIGGTAAAMMITSSSPKVSYFKAEADSYNFLIDQVKEKYKPEYDWYVKQQEEPTESKIDISANYNVPPTNTDPFAMDPAQIINNSTISILTQSDMENKEVSAGLSASIAGIAIDDINLYLTAEDLMLQTPFVNEILQVNDEDLGSILYELDPYTFTGDESIDFEAFFDTQNQVLAEEDIEYLKKEYLEFLYDEISEDAFTSTDETIEVNGESIKAEKIEFQLTEEEVKELLNLTIDKMKKDERLKEIIKDQIMYSQLGDSVVESEVDDMLADFETSLEDMKQDLAEVQIPNGLNSTIWVDDNLIVQRDFSIDIGPSTDDLIQLSVTGNQLFTDISQWFNYDFAFSDAYDEGSLQLEGDLNFEDNQGNDKIELTVGETILSYEASETLEDGSREFDRTFRFSEPAEDISILWNGVANYENDQMDSEHKLAIDTIDISKDMAELQLNIEGKVIDGVELPENENIRDLGTMSAEELYDYFEMEFYPALEEWMYGLLMGGGAGF